MSLSGDPRQLKLPVDHVDAGVRGSAPKGLGWRRNPELTAGKHRTHSHLDTRINRNSGELCA